MSPSPKPTRAVTAALVGEWIAECAGNVDHKSALYRLLAYTHKINRCLVVDNYSTREYNIHTLMSILFSTNYPASAIITLLYIAILLQIAYILPAAASASIKVEQ